MSSAASTDPSASSALTLREFFDSVRAGQLLVQRCRACSERAVPPKVICPSCYATDWERVPLTGLGEVASFTIIRVPPTRLASEAPYAVVVVRMEDGVSLLGRLVDVPLDAIRIGLPVRFLPPTDPPADPPIIRFAPRT